MSVFRRLSPARAVLFAGGLSLALPVVAQAPEEMKAVFRDLESTDPSVAERAEARLPLLWRELWGGDIGPALPELAERLRDGTALVRRYAALTLAGAAVTNARNAERLQQVAPVLILALADPDPGVRQGAVTAVSVMKPAPPAEAAAALLGLLEDPEVDVRRGALAALVRMRPIPPELRHFAVEQVKARSPLEPQAIQLLGGLPIESLYIVELVAERLASPDPALRTVALQALAKWGTMAEPALPRLRQMAADPNEDPTLRMLARNAIEQISGAESIDGP
jgi:HEAT repeat protein